MSRLRIGMDVDGVIYDWDSIFRFMAEHHHGIKLPVPTSWDTFPSLLPEEVWEWMWAEGVDQGMFRYGSLYKGSREALVALAKIGDLVVLTSRPPRAQAVTLEWLAYQRFPTAEIHILSKQPKSSVECDVYVDDASHNAVDLLLNTSGRVLLVDRPYNREFHVPDGVDPRRVTRVYSWTEVTVLVRDDALQHERESSR